jgi:hypothetical protein
MNKIKKFFASIWKYLSGKKRNIALIYWSLLVPAITIIWPEGAPPEVGKISSLVGLVLSYLGLGHAAAKKVAANKKIAETDELPNTEQ